MVHGGALHPAGYYVGGMGDAGTTTGLQGPTALPEPIPSAGVSAATAAAAAAVFTVTTAVVTVSAEVVTAAVAVHVIGPA